MGEFTSQNFEKKNLLKKKLFIFDQDGTIYLDFEVFPGFKEVLNYIESNDWRVVFISNNSSKSTSTYQKKLSKILGRDIPKEQIYVSTSATIQYLKENNMMRVYALGTEDFEKELEESGIELTEENPELVVVAFDTTLNYEKLKKACLLIQKGINYVATHPDKVCPTKEGDIPDTGSFLALIETATGKKPDKILGKPNPDIINFMLKKFDLTPEDAIIFGDRLYTDMKLGKNSGIATALILTGETKKQDLEKSEIKPDFVFNDWKEVLDLLKD